MNSLMSQHLPWSCTKDVQMERQKQQHISKAMEHVGSTCRHESIDEPAPALVLQEHDAVQAKQQRVSKAIKRVSSQGRSNIERW
jgi:hypothetical protein